MASPLVIRPLPPLPACLLSMPGLAPSALPARCPDLLLPAGRRERAIAIDCAEARRIIAGAGWSGLVWSGLVWSGRWGMTMGGMEMCNGSDLMYVLCTSAPAPPLSPKGFYSVLRPYLPTYLHIQYRQAGTLPSAYY
ncbi:hypothetical protein LY76DRAFT_353878 [Colletotrichum caudatum]|nr:hypothetical protein LY76DRAFT_353878 [Colletotrichum caudatum]